MLQPTTLNGGVKEAEEEVTDSFTIVKSYKNLE